MRLGDGQTVVSVLGVLSANRKLVPQSGIISGLPVIRSELDFARWYIGDLARMVVYFNLSQIKVRVTFTPSRVVVLNEIVSLSPVIVKWRSMSFPISPGKIAASRW